MNIAAAEGGCHCGAIRYTIEAGEVDSAYCHCRMCQQMSGAPTVAWISVAAVRFHYLKGKPKIYRSSPHAVREFCGGCGAPVLFRPDSGGTVDVPIATLDDPTIAPPQYHIWRMSRIDWFETTDHLPRHEDQGPDL